MVSQKILGKKVYRRKATMADERTVIDKFIDQFWLVNITRPQQAEEREFSIQEVDDKVHDLIHKMFLKAEDEKFNAY